MAFTNQLSDTLDTLDHRAENSSGSNLGQILDEYLRKIEESADSKILTSILLLDDEGKKLLHGAAPNLPTAYCEAIDGIEIGPLVGSCGTAAYAGHAIFVKDIATDPLWADFRDLALAHDLRSCWSTPIRTDDQRIVGTFAIYHPAPRAPTGDEILAIKSISGRVAQAIERWG